MAAFDPATLDRWRALAIVDRDGTTVGTISEFYLDRETGHPTWALVTTGLFGGTQTFVPLIHATELSDGLQVPYEKSHIRNAPIVDLHDELTPQEEAELFAHYGVEYEPSPESTPDTPEPGSGAGTGVATVPAGEAEPEPAGSPTVAGDEGPGPVRAEAGTAGPPTDAPAGHAPAAQPAARSSGGGEPPEGVPEEPGSVNPSGPADTGSPPAGPAGTAPGESGSGPQGITNAVPDEPGTAAPSEAPQADSERSLDPERPGSATGGSAELESGRFGSEQFRLEAEQGEDRTDSGPARSQAGGRDPNLARTAPVEPGLPGSTAASPYGPTPTVDKAAHRAETAADGPLRVSDETGWPPGAGAFEREPFDRPAGASDRWREAKLAAERDRSARAAAAQPEERSPLERARRRLERLVGAGQDHPDEVSPDDREVAERARRARLGLEDDERGR